MDMASSLTKDLEFRIPLVESDTSHYCRCNGKKKQLLSKEDIPASWIESFQRDGFILVPNVVASQEAVNTLNDRLEDVLRGNYDRRRKPDKTPRLLKGTKPTISTTNTSSIHHTTNGNQPTTSKKEKKKKEVGAIGFSGNFQNVRVLQIINIHKADSVYRRFETDPNLAKLVACLAGWEQGARLAQDQVWAKPPGAPPLVFHRDSPYFMFTPSDVVTVWLAMDDMDEELGPLEYVKSSHIWGDGRKGSANQFFQSTNPKHLVESAANYEGITLDQLEFVSLAGIPAGSMSIHDGKIWHGSGKNRSMSRPRRGLGLHFVPANVRFTHAAAKSSLWKSYVNPEKDPSEMELPEEDFPLSAPS